MAKKKGIDVNSVILVIVIVLVVGLSLGIFYKAPVESGEGELGQAGMGDEMQDGDEMPYNMVCCDKKSKGIITIFPLWKYNKGYCDLAGGEVVKDSICGFSCFASCSECNKAKGWEFCQSEHGCPERPGSF